MNMSRKANKLTVMAMLCALAFVAVVAIRIPLIPIVPFLEYEPKDVIILTGGFLFGPMSAAVISIIVSFIEMFTISSTGIIGLIMNILSTVAFVCPAAYLYKKHHSMKGGLPWYDCRNTSYDTDYGTVELFNHTDLYGLSQRSSCEASAPCLRTI